MDKFSLKQVRSSCGCCEGDVVSSDSVRSTTLTRENFRSDDDWKRVQEAHGSDVDAIDIDSRYVFEDIRIVPNTFDRNQLVLVAGTHDPKAQVFVNSFLPVRVFNLSITQPDVIEATHERMRSCFHPDGGGMEALGYATNQFCICQR